MGMSDSDRRKDALERAIINAIKYTNLEWDLTQEEILATLGNVRWDIRGLFRDANKDLNRKPKKDEPKDDE